MALPGTIGTHNTALLLGTLSRLSQEMRGHARRRSMVGWFNRLAYRRPLPKPITPFHDHKV
jgi:hypothetical protein